MRLHYRFRFGFESKFVSKVNFSYKLTKRKIIIRVNWTSIQC